MYRLGEGSPFVFRQKSGEDIFYTQQMQKNESNYVSNVLYGKLLREAFIASCKSTMLCFEHPGR